MPRCRMIFVTGTDTGVGKTVLTCLLLAHLRRRGCRALAMKPFCSGSRSDATLLRATQDNELTLDEVNPFYFTEPIAPLVAARKHRRSIKKRHALSLIRSVARRCDWLLIEGAGGVSAPLGEDFFLLDLIVRLEGEVLIVARNRLGAINHTLLTVAAAQKARIPSVKIALIGTARSDSASRSNPRILSELLPITPLIPMPYLGRKTKQAATLRRWSVRLRRRLEKMLRRPE